MMRWIHRVRETCGRVARKLRNQVKALGVRGSLRYWVRRRRQAEPGEAFQLRSRYADHPVYVRCGTSDSDVFDQVFVHLDYGSLADLPAVDLVVDCGANVGYASAFFLSQFPASRVIAIEPDAGNFAMLQRNLRPYGERVTAMHAGVWSRDTPLTIVRQPYRDGREWTVQVRPSAPDETPDAEGVGIASLLATSGSERISLLKIDIEGAEVELLRGNLDWLDRVGTLAIELHDDSHFGPAGELFQAAIRGRGFEVSHHSDLTICRRALV